METRTCAGCGRESTAEVCESCSERLHVLWSRSNCRAAAADVGPLSPEAFEAYAAARREEWQSMLLAVRNGGQLRALLVDLILVCELEQRVPHRDEWAELVELFERLVNNGGRTRETESGRQLAN